MHIRSIAAGDFVQALLEMRAMIRGISACIFLA
jgi:hypothetical protein